MLHKLMRDWRAWMDKAMHLTYKWEYFYRESQSLTARNWGKEWRDGGEVDVRKK